MYIDVTNYNWRRHCLKFKAHVCLKEPTLIKLITFLEDIKNLWRLSTMIIITLVQASIFLVKFIWLLCREWFP